MKQIRLWLTTVAVLLCSITASAYDFQVDGIYYNIISDENLTVEVTCEDIDESSGSYFDDVVIPSSVVYGGNTYSVTGVGNYAFYGCSTLTSITIPESITYFGYYVFTNCESLGAVYISNLEAWCNIDFWEAVSNPTYIANNLYLNGQLLTEVVIPNTITEIKYSTFLGCSNFTSITIPESVTSIGTYAFYGCTSLTDVTIPEGMKRIGDAAFYGCTSLTAVTIPESVDSIGTNAFLYCSNLTSIKLPDNLEYLGGQAFNATPWYTSLPDGEIYLYDWFYDYKGEMLENTTIELKEGTKGICYAAFYNCIGLASITIPESVNVIDSYAFENCLNLQSITLPANLQIISYGLFSGCSSLTSITIPESVTDIGYSAFENCSNLQSITLPTNLQIISSGLFYGCSSLTSITIPEGVTDIYDFAFGNCSNLQSITLPAKLQSISYGLFSGCSSLTSVTIPKGVTEIDSYAFRDCSSLTAMTLPSTIANIGWSAFDNSCKELTCLARTVPSVGGDLGSVQTVNVPSSAMTSYQNTYPWSELTILPILSDPIEIHVPSPGQLGNLLLNKVDQWTDVDCLTLSGSLNSDDLALLSRLTEMRTLDLSQTDITTMTGCRGLSKLSTVILPSTVTKIDEYAFYQCASLNSISLPNVVEVGDYAFYGTALESIELPQTKIIGDNAFRGTSEYVSGRYEYSSQLISIHIPLVTTIGDYAFENCVLLESISMPCVTSIGNYAFRSCNRLVNLDLSNVDVIGEYAFSSCASLASVVLSDKLESIPYNCFYQCTALSEINFPSSLKTIGGNAFYGCKGLSSVVLPEGFQQIGDKSFLGCPLKTISIPSTIETIHSKAFYDSGYSSYVPRNCTIYSYSIVPIATTAFKEMAPTATLYVSAFSLNAYRLHENWYNFDIHPMEEDLEKLYFNSDFSIYDYKGLADKVDMTLAYGSEYVNSWTSNIAPAHVTINANSTFTLGEYVQYQDLYNRESDYDYDLDQYIYTYPYCTSLITQNEITADKMCTNVYMRDGRWNFISFPYDVNVSDIVVPEGVLWVIRKYSGADRAAMTGNTWQNMTDGMVLKAGEGYIFHCTVISDNDEWDEDIVGVSFPSASNDAGTLFAYEDVVKTLSEYPSEYAHNRSWNLVGNPYPSYFNIQEIEFDAPITVWNGEGYTAYSLLDDNYVLTPNEAFFVQRPINAASMTFHKEGRMHELETTSEDYAPSFTRTRNAFTSRFVYNFLLADGSYTDRARLVVNEEAKMEYEVNCDASKFMSNNADVPQLYINEGGVKYAINERPLGSGIVTLGAYIGKAGEHTISLASNPNEEMAVMLTDRLTGTVTNLSIDSYTFSAEAGTSNDRFVIALARTTDIENGVANEAPITEVYTLDGKQVTDTDNLPIGVYLVKKGSEYVKHVISE